MSDAAAVPILGHFTKRASSITSNAKLYDLVQDMAGKVDDIPRQFDEVHTKLDTIMELIRGRISD
jgi:hypothetical protein